MDQSFDQRDSNKRPGDVEVQIMETVNKEKSHKCSQCQYASSKASNLRTHLKIHIGEKPNKCNQCDYASSQAGNLRAHLKTHSGEKSNNCNTCNYASSRRGDLKTHSGEKSRNLFMSRFL